MSDKHFKVYRISNEGVFDCLVYVNRTNVWGCSLSHYTKTFRGWSLDRLQLFIHNCKPKGTMKLIEASDHEPTAHIKGWNLRSYGLKPRPCKYPENWKPASWKDDKIYNPDDHIPEREFTQNYEDQVQEFLSEADDFINTNLAKEEKRENKPTVDVKIIKPIQSTSDEVKAKQEREKASKTAIIESVYDVDKLINDVLGDLTTLTAYDKTPTELIKEEDSYTDKINAFESESPFYTPEKIKKEGFKTTSVTPKKEAKPKPEKPKKWTPKGIKNKNIDTDAQMSLF